MAFKEAYRQFLMKVTGGKCAYEQYTEKDGFKECGRPARQVHHIKGEAEQLINGLDPEHSEGLPLCENHHVRNESDILGDPDASFHPDMSGAYKAYHEWKRQQEHMKEILGRSTIDYSSSPFAETARDHQEKAKKGERYISGDDGTDEYYIQKMRAETIKYMAEHPGEKRPNTSPHPRAKKKKKWYDYLED